MSNTWTEMFHRSAIEFNSCGRCLLVLSHYLHLVKKGTRLMAHRFLSMCFKTFGSIHLPDLS